MSPCCRCEVCGALTQDEALGGGRLMAHPTCRSLQGLQPFLTPSPQPKPNSNYPVMHRLSPDLPRTSERPLYSEGQGPQA